MSLSKSIFLFLTCVLGGCAGLDTMDRSVVNHPLMMFEDRLSQSRSYPLSGLGSGDSAVSQGCTVCAK